MRTIEEIASAARETQRDAEWCSEQDGCSYVNTDIRDAVDFVLYPEEKELRLEVLKYLGF